MPFVEAYRAFSADLTTTSNQTTSSWLTSTWTPITIGTTTTNYGFYGFELPTQLPQPTPFLAQRLARRLLHEHLSAAEAALLKAKGYFEVVGSDGPTYRIHRGYQQNVERLGVDGRPVERLCAHGRTTMPDEDHMLAQKLWLMADEAAFRAVAHITRMAA